MRYPTRASNGPNHLGLSGALLLANPPPPAAAAAQDWGHKKFVLVCIAAMLVSRLANILPGTALVK